MSKLVAFHCQIIDDEPVCHFQYENTKGETRLVKASIIDILKVIKGVIDYKTKKRIRQYFDKLVGKDN